MSLWTKPLSEVTFEDVQAFCDLQLPEGTEVEYKREIPNDLAKVVAAFANTAGGLVLLGVDEDDLSKPVVPICGMARERGISERITQICRDGISPSVLPEISPFLELSGDNKNGVVVIRVTRSPLAPHAIRNRTRVYVRTENVSDAFELADIDRIAAMLSEREQWEALRESIIESCISRYVHLAPVNNPPLFWAAVLPTYPDNEVCQPESCFGASLGSRTYRAAGGACGIRYEDLNGERCVTSTKFVGTRGQVVSVRLIVTPTANHLLEPSQKFYLKRPVQQLLDTCRRAQDLYRSESVAVRGLLSVCLGFRNIRGGCALDDDATTQLDEDLTFNERIHSNDFLAINLLQNQLPDFVHEIAKQVAWAFNVDPPPACLQDWPSY